MKISGKTVSFAVVFTAFTLIGAAALASELPQVTRLADARQYFAICPSVTATGVVREVLDWSYSSSPSSRSYGTVLKVVAREGEFTVYMGPSQYLKNMGYTFEPGQKLNIEGILASVDGNVMLLARGYTTGGVACTLRDPEGCLASR